MGSGHSRRLAGLLFIAALISACDTSVETTNSGGSASDAPGSVTTAQVAPTTTVRPGPILVDSPVSAAIEQVVFELADDAELQVERLGSWYTPIPAPDGAVVALESCDLIAPGLFLHTLIASGDVEYPYSASGVFSYSGGGDLAYMFRFTTEIPGPGRHQFLEPVANARYDSWDERLDQLDPYIDRIGREFNLGRSECWIGIEGASGGGAVRAGFATASIALTAPEGTVELLGQRAMSQGTASSMGPIAVIVGTAIPLYAQSWFIPETQDPMLTVRERLGENGCLRVETQYTSFSITQQTGCAPPETDPVYEDGDGWVAVATDGTWDIRVRADSRDEALEIATSLTAYHLMRHRPLPND